MCPMFNFIMVCDVTNMPRTKFKNLYSFLLLMQQIYRVNCHSMRKKVKNMPIRYKPNWLVCLKDIRRKIVKWWRLSTYMYYILITTAKNAFKMIELMECINNFMRECHQFVCKNLKYLVQCHWINCKCMSACYFLINIIYGKMIWYVICFSLKRHILFNLFKNTF